MMFSDAFSVLRQAGRKAVLPAERIKESLAAAVPAVCGPVVDLGAGTMYWSGWLARHYGARVLAVDTYYGDGRRSGIEGVECLGSYDMCRGVDRRDGMLFLCDVMHHLDAGTEAAVMSAIAAGEYRYVVVKDIDCRRRFGNLMNRLHDRVINREAIHDVDPASLAAAMEAAGYAARYEYMPKLWYPHFLLVGVRGGGRP